MTARELQIQDRLHKDGAREAADFMEAAMDGGDLETLIHNSDSAMYEVKNNGGIGWSFYNAALCHETKKIKGKS